jgi:N-acetylneuraminic acid mutarotase
MIIWGGEGAYNPTSATFVLGDGGVFNPSANTWIPTNTINAPSPRYYHSAVWTGSQMLVWGGTSDQSTKFGDGSAYNPLSNTWTTISTVNAPSPRFQHTAVWTGSKMIIWGGSNNGGLYGDGGIYDPASDTWAAISTVNAPATRNLHTAVWTGSTMIIWGGHSSLCSFPTYECGDGGIYDPSTDAWTSLGTVANAPSPRASHSAVWTGSQMIIWGGQGGSGNLVLNSGSTYDPAANTWSPITMTDAPAPSATAQSTAVWTGSKMIVWETISGSNPNLPSLVATGGVYDPIADAWTATSIAAAPAESENHGAVWTGSQMIIWGGITQISNGQSLQVGGLYTP